MKEKAAVHYQGTASAHAAEKELRRARQYLAAVCLKVIKSLMVCFGAGLERLRGVPLSPLTREQLHRGARARADPPTLTHPPGAACTRSLHVPPPPPLLQHGFTLYGRVNVET